MAVLEKIGLSLFQGIHQCAPRLHPFIEISLGRGDSSKHLAEFRCGYEFFRSQEIVSSFEIENNQIEIQYKNVEKDEPLLIQ